MRQLHRAKRLRREKIRARGLIYRVERTLPAESSSGHIKLVDESNIEDRNGSIPAAKFTAIASTWDVAA